MSTPADSPRSTASSTSALPPAQSAPPGSSLSRAPGVVLTPDQAELLAGAFGELLALTQNALARAQAGLVPDAGAVATGFLIAPRALAVALEVLLPAPDSPAALLALEHLEPLVSPGSSVLSALAGGHEEMDPELLSREVEAALSNLSDRVARLAPPDRDELE